MGKIKMTFTLDQQTADRLRQTADRLNAPMSRVVAEAIEDYGDRVGRLSERERTKLLRAFDELVPLIPERSLQDVKNELEEVRRARRHGGRTAGASGHT